MKTLKLIVFGIMLTLACSLQGQISVRLNIGSPPAWGPAGYSDVRYYYLPDVEAYYDVQTSMFIYMSGNRWIRRSYLPARYRDYDLYNGYKVVMHDYRGNAPYYNFRDYRVRYNRGYRGDAQRNIGERPGRGNSHINDRPANHIDYKPAPAIRRNDIQRNNQKQEKNIQRNNQKQEKNNNRNDGRNDDKGRK